ncbi:MAG: hypothetical protein ACO29Y_05755 [Holophagaceae bacterium]
MPNWCNNNLTLEHDDPQMIQRAYDALERGEFLQEFIPCPKELTETVSGHCGDGYAQELNQFKMELNLKYFGSKDWYDWNVSNWGTKWDVGEQGCSDIRPDGRMLHTYFDSAWSPPVNAYVKLEELGFRVNAMYYEGGMAFAGAYGSGNDEEINLEGMSADDIEQHYPEIDQAFGIAESIREYEAENQEELTQWIKEGVEAKNA